ncbi:MAG: hypothetical protein ABIK28_18785, partial [Planctomycetota bacterium]
FKGNGTTPPMNFAEVSLYFSNSCGTLNLDYDEVVITRRLYRSSESEYLINRTPCRLKDIKHLFMDTGIGVNAYSMMEQGKIDSVLQTDPVSRRAIFEEASGISRFKTRRKEAERKLERTHANLLRVGDIIEELEKRIRSLKNQAGRARSYLNNSDRLKEIKREYFLHLYYVLIDEKKIIAQGKAEAEADAVRYQDVLNVQKEAVAEFEKKIELFSESLYAQKNIYTETKTSQEETQIKVGYFEKRVHELDHEREEVDLRERELEASLKIKENDITEIQKRLEELGQEFRKVNEEAGNLARQAQQFEGEWEQALKTLQSFEAEVMELNRREVELKNRSIDVSARLKGAHSGFMRVGNRQNALAENMADVKQQHTRVEADLAQKQEERIQLQAELKEGRDRALEAEGKLRILDGDLKRIEDEIIKRETRIEVLQNLIDRREGVGRGVKSVLEEAGRDGSPLKFIKGMLGELVEVDVDHSTALEAALGKTAEAVVVGDLPEASEVIRYLRSKGKGRIKILPLSSFQSQDQEDPNRVSPDSSLLVDHVRCKDPQIQKVITKLLGDIRIILESRLMETHDQPQDQVIRSVTLAGDFSDEHGILTIGSSTPEQGVISRRSEMAALEKDLERFRVENDALSDKRKTARSEIECMTRSNSELADRISSQSQAVAILTAEREKHQERWNLVRREYDLNAWDAFELEMSIQSLKKALGDLHEQSQEVSGGLEGIRFKIQEARAAKEVRRVEKERLAEKRRHCEYQRVQLLERKEGIEKEHKLTENSLREVGERLADLVQDRSRLATMHMDIDTQLEE